MTNKELITIYDANERLRNRLLLNDFGASNNQNSELRNILNIKIKYDSLSGFHKSAFGTEKIDERLFPLTLKVLEDSSFS